MVYNICFLYHQEQGKQKCHTYWPQEIGPEHKIVFGQVCLQMSSNFYVQFKIIHSKLWIIKSLRFYFIIYNFWLLAIKKKINITYIW